MSKISPEAKKVLQSYSLEELQELSEEYAGICFACGEIQGECEPDARNYECESCGKPAVFGIEEAAIMGAI